MKKQNTLITQESTEVVLRKATNIINRTNKILKNSKRELVANPEIVVIDGLMYQNQPFTEKYTWDDAMEYAKNLRLGGYDDWRLPTREELLKLGNIKLWREDENQNLDCMEWFNKNEDKRLKNSQGNEYFIQEEFLENMPSSYIVDFWAGDEENLNCYGINFADGSDFTFKKSADFYLLCVREAKE